MIGIAFSGIRNLDLVSLKAEFFSWLLKKTWEGEPGYVFELEISIVAELCVIFSFEKCSLSFLNAIVSFLYYDWLSVVKMLVSIDDNEFSLFETSSIEDSLCLFKVFGRKSFKLNVFLRFSRFKSYTYCSSSLKILLSLAALPCILNKDFFCLSLVNSNPL